MTDAGFGDKMMGKAKETLGNLSGDDKMKLEGMADQAMGKVKEVADKVAKDASAAAADVAQKVKDAVDGDPNT